MTFINIDKEVILSWPRPGDLGPHRWHPSYRFHQPALEAVLRDGLASLPTVTLRTGCHIRSLQQFEDRVSVTFSDQDAVPNETIEGRYLVGCDGGRSTIRGLLGVPLRDLGSHDQWLVVDLLMKREVSGLTDGTVQFCDPKRPTTFMRCVGQRRRWEFMVMPGDDVEALTSADGVWALLSPWLTPQDADIERAVTYFFHGVIAEPWRTSRVLLAGDAAHQMPPFLGQGLCAGIRDASNLAWKLERVVTGQASASLLDTYELERAPHVQATIEHAIHIGEIIQTIDPNQARERDAKLGQGPRKMGSLAPRLGAGLQGDAPLPAGTIFPQPLLRSGARMDDVVGMNFAVLGERHLLENASAQTKKLWDDHHVACLPDEGTDSLLELGVKAVLIRPDRYILGVANTSEELDRICGLLAPA